MQFDQFGILTFLFHDFSTKLPRWLFLSVMVISVSESCPWTTSASWFMIKSWASQIHETCHWKAVSWSNHEHLKTMSHVTQETSAISMMTYEQWPPMYGNHTMVAYVIMRFTWCDYMPLSKISTTARTIFNVHNPWISSMIRTIINAHIPLSVPITHVIHDHPVLPLGPSSGR